MGPLVVVVVVVATALRLLLLLLAKVLLERPVSKPPLCPHLQTLAAAACQRNLHVVLERAERIAAAPRLAQLPRSGKSNRRVTPGRPRMLLRLQ